MFVIKHAIPFKEMFKGSYFGEGDIIFQRRRRYTVRALVDSQILTLSKQAFESLVEPEYPEVVEEMRKIAGERDQRFDMAKTCMKKFLAEGGRNIHTIFYDSDKEGFLKLRTILSKRKGRVVSNDASKLETNIPIDPGVSMMNQSVNDYSECMLLGDSRTIDNKSKDVGDISKISINDCNTTKEILPKQSIEEIKSVLELNKNLQFQDTMQCKVLSIKKGINDINEKQKVKFI